jgi:hypothetical protein
MLIEVYGEPSVLFLSAADELADEKNWMITVVAEVRSGRSPLTLFVLKLDALPPLPTRSVQRA